MLYRPYLDVNLTTVQREMILRARANVSAHMVTDFITWVSLEGFD
jgi:hypothetical protein